MFLLFLFRNQRVPPVNQLLITLRFYATGSHLLAIGDTHGVDVSTVSRIIKGVTNAIVRLRSQHIKMPSTARKIRQKQSSFYAIASFPFVYFGTSIWTAPMSKYNHQVNIIVNVESLVPTYT